MACNADQSNIDTSRDLIIIKPTAIVWMLGILVFILSAASLIGQYAALSSGNESTSGLIALINIDRELSVPSIFSVFLLFCIAILLAMITILKVKNNDTHIAGWAILAFGFLFMAFDEGATIHEKLVQPTLLLLSGIEIPHVFYFAWVIPAIIGVLLVALIYLKFIIDLPKKTRIAFLISGIIFISGAIGVEMASSYFVCIFGKENFGYNLIATCEEILEMAGLVFFIHALITYIGEHYEEVQLIIHTPAKSD